MFQVIVVLDEDRNKSYYNSYFDSEDITLGNMTCDELPPYQDINKAHACYWDVNNSKWIFDEEKYNSIMSKIAAEKEAAEQAALEAKATPTNAELAECAMELGEGQSNLEGAVLELADGQSNLEEAVTKLNELYTVLNERVTALETLEQTESTKEAQNGGDE